MKRTWSGLVLESTIKYGCAARRNRGRYAGHKFHRLHCEYVVGLEPGYEPRPGTLGAAFKREGKPVLFSCHPCCGCTSGQMAGLPSERLTEADVTCEKCLPPPPSLATGLVGKATL